MSYISLLSYLLTYCEVMSRACDVTASHPCSVYNGGCVENAECEELPPGSNASVNCSCLPGFTGTDCTGLATVHHCILTIITVIIIIIIIVIILLSTLTFICLHYRNCLEMLNFSEILESQISGQVTIIIEF